MIRRTSFARAVEEKWLCLFEHDPEVQWGTIVEDVRGKRRVEPFRD